MEKIINETWKFVTKELKNEYSGHDINHIKRVHKIGMDIVDNIECDKFVVEMALILHDVDDPKITKVKTDDCIITRKYLETKNINKEQINHICNIINNMSFSKNKEIKRELTLEGKIVQDADRIDALGAVGIARTFQYGGQNNREMENSIEHFDDKLLKLYDLLNTEEAKEIAKERNEFIINFYKQIKKEMEV